MAQIGRPRLRCLYPGCREHKVGRGLCTLHYAAAHKFISLGKVDSWDRLVKLGKANEPVNRKRDHGTKYGWFLDLTKRKGNKPLAKWMFKVLAMASPKAKALD